MRLTSLLVLPKSERGRCMHSSSHAVVGCISRRLFAWGTMFTEEKERSLLSSFSVYAYYSLPGTS